jgi:hypothetical protein
MQISELAMRLIILFVPGLVAVLVVDSLTIHRKWSSFEFSIYAILLGFMSYIFYQLVLDLIGLCNLFTSKTYTHKVVTFWSSLFNNTIPISINELIYTCLCGFTLGLMVTLAINNKYLYRLGKALCVTDVYGEEELYTAFMRSDVVKWVWIRHTSIGLTYEGWVKNFSEDDNLHEIVLGDVKIYSTVDSTLLYELSSIYLVAPRGTFVIEIPTDPMENKKNDGRNN